MKKLLSFTLILALVGAICLFTIGCTTDATDPTAGKNPAGNQPLATATSYVVLDINPTVELTVSEDEVIVSAGAENDDAKILLDQAAVEGKTLEEATEEIADVSVELGFIKEGENTEISITVVGDTAEIEERVYEKIKNKICKHIEEKHHFHLGVEKDVLLTIETELNELKAANPDNKAIQALNVARYRMIVSAMEKDSTITLETALTMSTRDLIRVIRDGAHKDIRKELERLEIEAEYEMQKIKDKVYAEMGIFMQLEGVQLAALRTFEFQVELLEELELENCKTISLTEGNVREVAALLGLTEEETTAFVEKCVGLDGTYSVHNMKLAINCLYRNLPRADREAFEDRYDRVEDYLETLEIAIPVPQELVVVLRGYVEAFNAIAVKNPVTMPEAFASITEVDAFLEVFEEAIEEEIERIEEILEEKIEDLGLEEKFEQKMDALERELDAKEDEMEREHDRIKGELDEEFRQHMNAWMDRHNGGHHGNGGNHP